MADAPRSLSKSIRLPADLVDAAEARARELGLTFNDIVEDAMRMHLGMTRNMGFDVLEGVKEYLLAKYPRRRGFGQDVTLEVFRHIRAEPELWRQYQATITDEEGEVVLEARHSLHKRIGKAVKLILDAEVVGRSLPLDPDKELINSHALLVPSASRRGRGAQ